VSWYDWLARRLLYKYSAVYLIQLYREQQKCAPACWNAEGLHCECSCMGENHGSGHPGERWREVSETFAFADKGPEVVNNLNRLQPFSLHNECHFNKWSKLPFLKADST